eukprot:1071291-Prymnesium_polylepis.1
MVLEQLAREASLPAPTLLPHGATSTVRTTEAEDAAATALEAFLLSRGGDGAIDLHVTPRH